MAEDGRELEVEEKVVIQEKRWGLSGRSQVYDVMTGKAVASFAP